MVKPLVGQMGRVIVGHLDPHEDLLVAIKELVSSHGIRAGVVLSVTGGLEHAVLQHFKPGREAVGLTEVDGPMEASGHGIVGTVVAPEKGDEPFGVGQYVHGDSYVHVHLTVTSATQTIMGHLMPGTTVRSNNPISHFTIMIVEVEAVAIEIRFDESIDRGGKGFGVYHHVAAINS